MRPRVPELERYLRIWRRAVAMHFGTIVASRSDFVFFFVGKMVRMGFFLVFFLSIFGVAPTVAGYSEGEVLLFFATMNLIDVLIQISWYRGFFLLPRMVTSGDFDFMLTKPVSPLFMIAFHIFDFLDLTTLPVALVLLWYAFSLLPPLGALQWVWYALFLANALALAFAINMTLAAMTFWAVRSSNLWGVFRDLMYVLRFPPEIFPHGVRMFLTYVVPMLVIVSFPVKAAIGRLAPASGIYGLAISVAALVLATKLWHRGLRAYSSASS